MERRQNYAPIPYQFNPAMQQNAQGLILCTQNKFEEALPFFETAISMLPQNTDGYFNKGNCLLELQRYREAIQVYDKILDMNSSLVDVHYNKGLCFFYLERFSEAIELFAKVIYLDSSFLEAYLKKGICHLNQGEEDEALTMFDFVLSSFPKDEEALFNKGVSFMNLKRFSEAKNLFEKASNFDIEDLDYYLGICFLQQDGGHQKASEKFRKAILKNPKDSRAYELNGHCLYNLESFNEALINFESAITLKPDDYQLYFYKQSCYDKLGRRKEAHETMKQAISKIPNEKSGFFEKERFMFNFEKQYEAAETFKSRFKIYPEEMLKIFKAIGIQPSPLENLNREILKEANLLKKDQWRIDLPQRENFESDSLLKVLKFMEQAEASGHQSKESDYLRSQVLRRLKEDHEAITYLDKFISFYSQMKAFLPNYDFTFLGDYTINVPVLTQEMPLFFEDYTISQPNQELAKDFTDKYKEPIIRDHSSQNKKLPEEEKKEIPLFLEGSKSSRIIEEGIDDYQSATNPSLSKENVSLSKTLLEADDSTVQNQGSNLRQNNEYFNWESMLVTRSSQLFELPNSAHESRESVAQSQLS